ncbi:hypothetical protein QN277_005440 [Acacia crassicarpa]|uniref:PGG domain-containing protein n=1 Tax=Acacia crassicarpa TaxID=499986 RepID=A0AAE1IY07_9FABA|nr:hypothetical protein QN277_005440 [Acacia crassicarpa]
MGKKRSEIEIEGGNMFSETMRRAQVAYRNFDWKAFKQIFEQDKTELFNHFDLFENTPIKIAIRSGDPKLLKDLLDMLSGEERWVAFTKPNCRGNTLLHIIALRKRTLSAQMADVILDFEKKEAAALAEEERKKRGPKLLERKNKWGATPLFRAAAFGNLKMLKHVVKKHIIAEEAEGDLFKIHQYSKRETILHACINGQHFDVALWIISKMNGGRLIRERNENKLTCLELLAIMPSAFRSCCTMGSLHDLIYNLLPDERYQFLEGGDSSNESCGHPIDIEAGPYHETAKPATSGYLSRINYVVWNNLAKVFDGIESLWKEKKKHQLAKRLVEFLVMHDLTWQISHRHGPSDSQELQLPPRLYNVKKRKQQLDRKEQKEEDNDQSKVLRHYSAPLFAAASNGIEEIVDSFLKEHPVSLNYMGVHGMTNILHIAVRHRQLKIFRLLKKNPWFSSLGYQISSTNYTALHEVASLDYYRGSSQPGAAFKLQEELKWFKRVEKEVPNHLHLHCDNRALTAKDVLEMEHHDMLENAQNWIKQTAESCSTVAVLVATVVFAAAYTIPGGSEGGTPVLVKSPVFIFFTIMDIVALAFSLSSVVMFLSILTSPFELWDFHKSLPRKLNLGFAFLFVALTSTILAFCATVLLTIKLPWKNWTSTLVYSASFFPVAIFGSIEFPLYMKIPMLLRKAGKKAMKATKAVGGMVRRFKRPKTE